MDKLKQFNRRVSRLEQSIFIKWFFSDRERPQDNDALAKNWLSLKGLHEDEFDGFVLNFRYLIQDRDGFSLKKIGELYDHLSEDFKSEKKRFGRLRGQLKDYLEEISFIQISEKNTTNRHFFEVIFYGGLAHENQEKIHDFRLLTSGIINGLVFFYFVKILLQYMKTFIQVKELNERVLEKRAAN